MRMAHHARLHSMTNSRETSQQYDGGGDRPQRRNSAGDANCERCERCERCEGCERCEMSRMTGDDQVDRDCISSRAGLLYMYRRSHPSDLNKDKTPAISGRRQR